jgi:hypothetical protein
MILKLVELGTCGESRILYSGIQSIRFETWREEIDRMRQEIDSNEMQSFLNSTWKSGDKAFVTLATLTMQDKSVKYIAFDAGFEGFLCNDNGKTLEVIR